MSLNEYKTGQAFSGAIGRTFDVSQPAWPHQLDRVTNGVGNRMKIGVHDIAPSRVVPQRSGAGWMEADRCVQLLELGP